MSNLIDSGWAAWLPEELVLAYDALGAGSAARRDLRTRLQKANSDPERWERFRMVAPSRVDVPELNGLTTDDCYALLEQLGLVAGDPPRALQPEPVELTLTLDHEQVRELEQVRMVREPDAGTTPVEALPSLESKFGGGDVGRNDPCPCGSGKKFKKCHGR